MFKRIALVLMLSMLAPAGGIQAQCMPQPGDINLDGATNIADMQCLLLAAVHLLGNPEFPALPECLKVSPAVADLSCDGTIDVADLVILVSYAVEYPLSPLIDFDGSGCPDACEVPGDFFVVPAAFSGRSSGAIYSLDALGASIAASGLSTGGGLSLQPKAVGLAVEP